MKILELLDELEDVIAQSSSFILTGKKMVDADVIAEIIEDIRTALPEELEAAKSVVNEKQRIMVSAQTEAEGLMKRAEDRIKDLVNDHELTQRAYQQSQEILSTAQASAREIRMGSKTYASGMLEDVLASVREMEAILQQNIAELNQK